MGGKCEESASDAAQHQKRLSRGPHMISEQYGPTLKRMGESHCFTCHVAPPVVVRRIVPCHPTAVPVLASVNDTSLRCSCVRLTCFDHVTPPSVVRRMIPASPTTVPVSVSEKETAVSFKVVPLYWTVQCAPPSTVRMIVPARPTAVPILCAANVTSCRSFPCGRGFCQNQPD